MAENPLVPDELTTAGLPTARRGYDRKAVASLVEEAARRWGELQRHYDEMVAEIERRGGIENLGRDLREIGERVATILGEAQAAAEELRTHATEESQARLEAAAGEAAVHVAEAEQTAFEWRRDAWEAAVALLEQVRQAAAEMIERAEADVLIIRAQAEQDAHRHIVDARKESSDMVRAGRYEAERLVGEAKRRADELLSEAAAGGPPEPDVRASWWGVKVIGTEGRQLGGDPAVEIDPHHPAYGDVLAAEVGSLRDQETARPLPPAPEPAEEMPAEHEVGPPPAAEPPEQAEALEEAVEPPGDAVEPMPDEEPEEEAVSEPNVPPAAPAPAGDADDLGDLFERLKRTDETPVFPTEEEEPPPEPAVVQEPEEPVEPLPPIVRGPDPVEVRDRVLLPILNGVVRAARRELLEVQNEALDELRTLRRGQAWTPEAAVLAGRVHDAALPVAAAAVEAGGRGASDLGAGPAPDPVSAERAEGLVEGMTEALEAAIIGAAATEDPAAEAGRKFRSWRNDEVGRWIRTAAYAGYHDGLVAGLAAAGIAEIVGVRHGRLCKDCPAAVGVVWDPAGSPPEGYASPPAHLDCGCAVQPHL